MKNYVKNIFDLFLGLCVLAISLVYFDVIDYKYQNFAVWGMIVSAIYWVIEYIVEKNKS